MPWVTADARSGRSCLSQGSYSFYSSPLAGAFGLASSLAALAIQTIGGRPLSASHRARAASIPIPSRCPPRGIKHRNHQFPNFPCKNRCWRIRQPAQNLHRPLWRTAVASQAAVKTPLLRPPFRPIINVFWCRARKRRQAWRSCYRIWALTAANPPRPTTRPPRLLLNSDHLSVKWTPGR